MDFSKVLEMSLQVGGLLTIGLIVVWPSGGLVVRLAKMRDDREEEREAHEMKKLDRDAEREATHDASVSKMLELLDRRRREDHEETRRIITAEAHNTREIIRAVFDPLNESIRTYRDAARSSVNPHG